MSRFRPTPALVVAMLALVLAMTGGAVAASKITGKQIASNTITGKNIKAGSLSASDLSRSARNALRGARGPVGPRGVPGMNGANGANGAPGANGTTNVTYVDGPPVSVAADSLGLAEATCPPGTVPTGGSTGVESEISTFFFTDLFLDETGFSIEAVNTDTGAPHVLQARVACARR